MESSKEELEKISETLNRIRNIVGPIIPSALATLQGWTWKAETTQERILLNRGAGPVPLIPSTEIQQEKGWLNLVWVMFSDPESVMRFSCDQWVFQATPFITRTFGLLAPNNSIIYCPVYNPATPLGPLYGMLWNPGEFWPYNTQVRISVEHPPTALTATSQVVIYVVGRHFISNEVLFYESIVREGERQAIGRVQVPIRRSP